MVRPDDKADDRNADTGRRDKAVAKDRLADESGNDFADHAHRRENHDVDGGMRIKPE